MLVLHRCIPPLAPNSGCYLRVSNWVTKEAGDGCTFLSLPERDVFKSVLAGTPLAGRACTVMGRKLISWNGTHVARLLDMHPSTSFETGRLGSLSKNVEA